ncbi:transposase [Variovorax boronicumulans]|nr:transposase [Variovorax boronicumulans]MDQ0005325.1 transposase [Variovorax boronicumulans]
MSDDERAQLQSFARSRSLPAALCNRAGLVLASAAGEPNNAIAARLKMTKQTVGKWRARFVERRITGLYDDVRPGKPRTIDDERVAQLINTTLHTKPANGSTHWSVRTVAARQASPRPVCSATSNSLACSRTVPRASVSAASRPS